MAYGSSYEERVAAIPGTRVAPAREVLPSTEEILARGSDAALQAGRTAYEPQFGPRGTVSGSPAYTGKKNVPQQYYGSEADIMQSDVIRNTESAPFATRAAVQNARLQEGRKLNLEYGDDTYGKTSITGTSSLPSGRVNVFSGSSAPQTEAQRANEAARVAEGQRVAAMYQREAAGRDTAGAIPSRGVQFNPETDVYGSASTPWGALLSAGIKGKQARLAKEEAGRTTRTAMGEEGATSRAELAARQRAGEFGQEQALEREKMGVGSEESRARAGLLGVQTEAAGYGLEAAKRASAAQKVLDNPQKYSPEQVAGARAFLERGLQEKIALEQAKARAKVEAEGFANGGEVRQSYFDPSAAWEKVKTGALGAIGMGVKEPAPAPAAIPTRASVEPDPSKGMWTLSEEEQAALPRYGYADGGTVGEDTRVAKYGQYLQAAAQSNITPVPFAQYAAMTQGVDQQMRAPVGYADGGDVSALERPLRGPGTGTSDSIPAVIDGVRPAALSTGEFVFDEATTKYYGTKFLKDLQRKAKEAEQGVKDGE